MFNPLPGSRLLAGKLSKRGSATVEFAFAVVVIMFFFLAFIELSGFFIAYDKLLLGSRVAARAAAVGGDATRAAHAIDKRIRISKSGNRVVAKLDLELSLDPRNLSRKPTRNRFTLERELRYFREPDLSGDNKL